MVILNVGEEDEGAAQPRSSKIEPEDIKMKGETGCVDHLCTSCPRQVYTYVVRCIIEIFNVKVVI